MRELQIEDEQSNGSKHRVCHGFAFKQHQKIKDKQEAKEDKKSTQLQKYGNEDLSHHNISPPLEEYNIDMFKFGNQIMME